MSSEMIPVGYLPPAKIGSGSWMQSSYDLSEPKQALKAFNAVSGQCLSLLEADGEVIDIAHVVMHPKQLPRKDGPGTEAVVRVVLVSGDGTKFETFAASVREWLEQACLFRGPPPWWPPLKVLVRVGKLDGGKTWFFIELQE